MSKFVKVSMFVVIAIVCTVMLGTTGKMNHVVAQPAQATASPTEEAPAATPEVAAKYTEQEVTFTNGSLTIYGTLTLPEGASADHKVPAMLLLSGSGPTDRDGNTKLLPGEVNSHKFFAQVLANAGVASLRYDKLASGKTGIGDFASHLGDLDFEEYVNEAIAGFNTLKGREEVDVTRIGVLGHSEGGLIAMVVADRLKAGKEPGVRALILAAPVPKPYLTLLRDQIQGQYDAAVKSGMYTQEQAKAGMKELDDIIASLMKDGTVPSTISQQFQAIFNPANLKFLAQVNKYDPATLAEGLPTTLPTLIMCGEKDVQVKCDDVKYLMEGFKRAGNTNATLHELPNVIHVFKVVEGTPTGMADYTNPKLPFSPEAEKLITEFVGKAFAAK